ncbi:hypothetical protein Trydic_g13749 [Trypoxylus dichotomus]
MISPKPCPCPKPEVVGNLSSRPLSDREELVLAKRSKLRYIPQKKEEYYCECHCRPNPFRNSQIPPRSNLTHEETRALRNLRSDHDSIILSVDKGNATEVSSLIKASNIPLEIQRRLILQNSKSPRLYGLPKIHKEVVSLRTIASTIDSHKYKLTKYLSGILKEYTSNTLSHVLNSTDFVEFISEITIQPTDLLPSFDATILFTEEPIPDALNIIEQLLEHDNKSSDLTRLIDKCFTRPMYFVFQGTAPQLALVVP